MKRKGVCHSCHFYRLVYMYEIQGIFHCKNQVILCDISDIREDDNMAIVDQVKMDFILSTLKNMEYGSVIITVHDGTITQIDKTEKTRFAQRNSPLKNSNKYKDMMTSQK